MTHELQLEKKQTSMTRQNWSLCSQWLAEDHSPVFTDIFRSGNSQTVHGQFPSYCRSHVFQRTSLHIPTTKSHYNAISPV